LLSATTTLTQPLPQSNNQADAFVQGLGGFPSATPFDVKIDSEVMEVTTVFDSHQEFLATRGVNGVVQQHNIGATVTLVNPGPTVNPAANQVAVRGVAQAFDLGSFSDPSGGPWNVDVNWGDGTADSLFVATNAGALGAQTHTYGAAGDDPVKVTVTNSANLSSSASFQINVSAPAGGPVAKDDNAQTTVNQPVTITDLLANDSDTNGVGFSVSSVDSNTTNGGHATLNPGGTVTYTPAANFQGTDSFEYTITDNNGLSAQAKVTVQVLSQVSTPVAVTEFAVSNGEPVTIPVQADNVDFSHPTDNTLHVVPGSVSAPANGTAVLNADGSVTYTPNLGFTGVNVFTYTVQNAQGGTATGVVSFAVGLSQNQAFVASDYAKVLGRAPSPTEEKAADEDIGILINAALEQDEAKGLVPDSVAAQQQAYSNYLQGMETSDESLQRQVKQAYRDLLGRDPDPSGLADKLGQLKNGASIDDVRTNVALSLEYAQKHPDYVGSLYRLYLGRDPDADGMKFFSDLLAKGAKGDVVNGISHSDEALKRYVATDYQNYLHRQPDANGSQYWFNVLKQALTNPAQAATNATKAASNATQAATNAAKDAKLKVDLGIYLSQEGLQNLLPSK
jgi:hypothetical protein